MSKLERVNYSLKRLPGYLMSALLLVGLLWVAVSAALTTR